MGASSIKHMSVEHCWSRQQHAEVQSTILLRNACLQE